jgi:hypothetical protein
MRHDIMNKIEAVLGTLDELELHEVNRRCVDKIRQIHQAKAFAKLSAFRVGDLVAFNDRYGRPTTILVDRINQRSVSGFTNDAMRKKWRVDASLCRLVGADKLAA